LFTDIAMPGGMDGLALAERARALRPGLRVLFATGYSDDLVVRGASTPGGADVLAKPYGGPTSRSACGPSSAAATVRPAPGPAREG
jgi:CheY-like chemotaxis protein